MSLYFIQNQYLECFYEENVYLQLTSLSLKLANIRKPRKVNEYFMIRL